jgi:integrase
VVTVPWPRAGWPTRVRLGTVKPSLPFNREKVGKENYADVSPHTLRRTFGSYLLSRSAAIEDISKLLPHADVRVTQQAYAELLDETVARRTLAVVGRA